MTLEFKSAPFKGDGECDLAQVQLHKVEIPESDLYLTCGGVAACVYLFSCTLVFIVCTFMHKAGITIAPGEEIFLPLCLGFLSALVSFVRCRNSEIELKLQFQAMKDRSSDFLKIRVFDRHRISDVRKPKQHQASAGNPGTPIPGGASNAMPGTIRPARNFSE